jgi:DNA-binding LacI/PurR family transcriptional regulator
MLGDHSSLRNEGAFRPFYRRLVDDVLEKIRDGVYADGQMLPSERELCLHYNVSRQTVRNALKLLSQQGWIASRAGKGSCVQNPPQKPGTSEKRLRGGTRQIGFICNVRTYLQDPGMMDTLMGLKSVFSREGYSVSLSVSKRDEAHQIYPLYPEWFRKGEMDGYICASVSPSLQRELAERGVPAISSGYIWENIDLPSVAVDFRSIYREAVAHLHAKGHERICNLVLSEDSKFTREVLAGYDEGRLALNKSTAEIAVERFEDTDYDFVSALRRTLKAKPAPTAIITQGVDHLDAAMRFFANEGIRVPEDLFLMAMQVRPNSCKHVDSLCYFDYEPMNMARRVAEKLLEIIKTRTTDPFHELHFGGRFVDPGQTVEPLRAATLAESVSAREAAPLK